jgi:hypothetical protein
MSQLNIISLNTAGSRFTGLNAFLQDHSSGCDSADVYCFQEIISSYKNPTISEKLWRTIPFYANQGERCNHGEVVAILDGYIHHFAAHEDFLESWAPDGNLISVRVQTRAMRNWKLLDYGAQPIFALKEKGGNVILQWVVLTEGLDSTMKNSWLQGRKVSQVLIANIHGCWENSIKTDTPLKLQQSLRIIACLQRLKILYSSAKIILCGDFNIASNTRACSMIEEFGLVNANRLFSVYDTRSSVYTKPVREADYFFVDSRITISNLQVIPVDISDHRPLQLICDVD